MYSKEKLPRPEDLGGIWHVCARFPCLVSCLFILIISGVTIPWYFTTPIWPMDIESDFNAYLQSDEPASAQYRYIYGIRNGKDDVEEAATSSAGLSIFVENRDLRTIRYHTYVELIYFCGHYCDTMYTEEKLNAIRTFEQKLESQDFYQAYCSLDTSSGNCKESDSVLNFFFPTKLENGVVRFDGNGNELVDIDSVLEMFLERGDFWFTSRSFVVNGKKAPIARTRLKFQFATPADLDKLGKKFLLPFLQENQNLPHGVRVLWFNERLIDLEVEETVYHDIQYGGISLVIVFIFMWLHSQSLYLSVMAVVSVALSFPATYVIYHLVFGYHEMKMLNFASVFIIIGIGADDFFIFCDLWTQSRCLGMEMPARVYWTWKRAASATFVTSVTTAASFFANMASAVGPIREFGCFMAIIVLVNYVNIVLILPGALVFHDRYFQQVSIMKKCPNPWKQDRKRRRDTLLSTDSAATNDEEGSRMFYVDDDDNGRATNHAEPTASNSMTTTTTTDDTIHIVDKGQVHLSFMDSFMVPESPGHQNSRDHSFSAVVEGEDEETRGTVTTGRNEEHIRPSERTASDDDTSPDLSQYRYLVRMFYEKIGPVVYNRRYLFVAAFSLVSIVFSVLLANRIEISDELPVIFSEETNMGMMLDIRRAFFADQTSLPESNGNNNEAPICGNTLCTYPPTNPPTQMVPTQRMTPAPSTIRTPTSVPAPTTTTPPTTTKSPTVSPIPLPTLAPSTVLIVNGSTLVPYQFGEGLPVDGYVRAVTTNPYVADNLCPPGIPFNGENADGRFVIGYANTSCTFEDKVFHTIDNLGVSTTILGIIGTNEATGSGVDVLPTLAVNDSTILLSATSISLGKPVVVNVRLVNNNIRLRRRVLAGALNFGGVDSKLMFSDHPVNPTYLSIVVPSFSLNDALALSRYLYETYPNTVDYTEIVPSYDLNAPTPTFVPTRAPITTTSSPTFAPVPMTTSPSNAPSSAPVVPTREPTFLECSCSGHGTCDVATDSCQCYPGWLEESDCSEIDPSYKALGDSAVAVVDIVWTSANVNNQFLGAFDSFLSMCEAVRNHSALLNVRRVERCIMETYREEYPVHTSDEAEFRSRLVTIVQKNGNIFAKDVVFDNNNQIKFVSFPVRTNINRVSVATEAHEEYVIWEDFVKERDPRAIQVSELWARAETELAIIDGTVLSGIISISAAFVSILIFTRFNLFIALFSSLSILMTVLLLEGVLIMLMGRDFGSLEALAVIIFIGMSCDFVCHLAHSFNHATRSGSLTLKEGTMQALGQTGPSILLAALTTVSASLVLLFCNIAVFNEFGLFIAINTTISIFVAVFFLVPSLNVGLTSYRFVKRKCHDKFIDGTEAASSNGEASSSNSSDGSRSVNYLEQPPSATLVML